MDDLISRSDVLDAIVEWTVEDRPDIEMPTDLVDRINALLPAQPEIIRCKDCAYCGRDVVDVLYGQTINVWWCDILYTGEDENLIVEPDDFCFMGRKGE